MSTPVIDIDDRGELRTLPGAPPDDLDDEILRWTYYLQEVFRRLTGGSPAPMARAAAMMYGAIYDAVNSIDTIGAPYLGTVPVPGGCSVDRQQCLAAAVNDAAAFVLAGSLRRPDVILYVLAAYLAEDGRIGQGPGGGAGRRVGRRAALRMLRARQGDGSDNDQPYDPGSLPGAWRPTGSGCNIATTPSWGRVTPFAMTSGSQFRPQRPGGFPSYAELLRSDLYAEQFDEVRRVGRFDAEDRGDRTPEQSEIAVFWSNDVDGSYHPPGHHLDHTRIISQQCGLTLQQNARLFGLVGLAFGDAGIVAFDSKYETGIDLWRPETAIQLADTDGNDATTADPGWEPFLLNRAGDTRVNPCFPAYTSGHATFGGAWARLMQLYFETDSMTFVATTDDPQARGVTRTFTSFSAVAAEDAESRVFLGVHFRFDGEFGRAAGESLAEFVFSTQLQPV